jgi:glycosyltransferase involved in cell wall biosynthesis
VRSWAIVTGEYPPQPGGVSDYVGNIAGQLGAAGDAVTVWAPHRKDTAKNGNVVIKPFRLTPFSAGARRFASQLESLPPDTRVLLQYAPHAFGLKGMNMPLARLLSRLRRHPLDVMFHEVAYPYHRQGAPRYRLLAKAQNYMARVVAKRADRIFVSALAWKPLLEMIVGEPLAVEWLPVPSNLPLEVSTSGVATLRAQLAPASGFLFGHFGTYGEGITKHLRHAIPKLLGASDERRCLLLGRGAVRFRASLLERDGAFASRIQARENLEPVALVHHLAACDAMIQPFPDGVNGRRTSLMASIALGIPTITTSGRFTESVWHTADGVAISLDSPEDFARVAEEVFASPERRHRLARGGMDLYRKHFAVEHTIARLRAIPDRPLAKT